MFGLLVLLFLFILFPLLAPLWIFLLIIYGLSALLKTKKTKDAATADPQSIRWGMVIFGLILGVLIPPLMPIVLVLVAVYLISYALNKKKETPPPVTADDQPKLSYGWIIFALVIGFIIPPLLPIVLLGIVLYVVVAFNRTGVMSAKKTPIQPNPRREYQYDDFKYDRRRDSRPRLRDWRTEASEEDLPSTMKATDDLGRCRRQMDEAIAKARRASDEAMAQASQSSIDHWPVQPPPFSNIKFDPNTVSAVGQHICRAAAAALPQAQQMLQGLSQAATSMGVV